MSQENQSRFEKPTQKNNAKKKKNGNFCFDIWEAIGNFFRALQSEKTMNRSI